MLGGGQTACSGGGGSGRLAGGLDCGALEGRVLLAARPTNVVDGWNVTTLGGTSPTNEAGSEKSPS